MSTAPVRGEPARWLTRANALSALRLLSAPALALAIARGAHATAAALFAFAVATDLVDGRVARRYGESSPLGGLLDHASDAAFVTAGLAALATAGQLPAALPALVALAFLQYALDSGSLRAPGAAAPPRPLRASALGRWNGIAYYVLVGIPVVRDALGLGWPGRRLVYALGVLFAASTLLSMADRARSLWRARGSG